MPMQPDEIERLIKDRIPDAEVTIRDLAGDGDHYAATVISASFRGASCGELEFELYQTCGIQVAGLIALGFRTQFFTHSGVSFEPMRVRFGPGFRSPSKPRVLWHA